MLVGLGALEALGDEAGAESLGRCPDAFSLAVDDDANLLEIRLELACRAAGDLDTDAAEVLGLTAVGTLATNLGATAGINAFVWHGQIPSKTSHALYRGGGLNATLWFRDSKRENRAYTPLPSAT